MGRACLWFLNLPSPFPLRKSACIVAENSDRHGISRKLFGAAQDKLRDRELLEPQLHYVPVRNDNLLHTKVYF